MPVAWGRRAASPFRGAGQQVGLGLPHYATGMVETRNEIFWNRPTTHNQRPHNPAPGSGCGPLSPVVRREENRIDKYLRAGWDERLSRGTGLLPVVPVTGRRRAAAK